MAKPGFGCSNAECSASTGIHEGLTFGSGRLSDNGFWERPCATCARAYEALHPNDGACWPYPEQDVAKLEAEAKADLDEEDRRWRGFYQDI